jgi:NDP-sugar pyrophosphorylase family protein
MNSSTIDIPVAILAGGLATRMRPWTEKIPKSLLPVADEPFLAHQLRLLHKQGIRRVVLCVGYLGEMIQNEFGDGSAFGVHLDYAFDGPVLLGTGGAIKQALPKLDSEFFVLYGDSYLPVDLQPIVATYQRSGRSGLMTVYENLGKYDTSNVVFRDGEVVMYDKKARLPEMRHIDYGLEIFKASVFDAYAGDRAFDLAGVMTDLVTQRQMAAYEMRERFFEIGSPAGLAELEEKLRAA